MLDRRTFLGGAVSIIAAPLAAEAQQAGKVWRIGVLIPSATELRSSSLWAPFVEGLRDLGYVEGKNITIESRHSLSIDRLRDLANELVLLQVDVIVAVTTVAAQAAKMVTSRIPIVFTNVADPIAPGVVTSLASSGGNITGLSSMVTEMTGKRLELLKEALPTISRVAVLWWKESRGSEVIFRQAEAAGISLRLQIQSLAVLGDDFPSAFEMASRDRAGAVLVVDNPILLAAYRPQIVDLAMKRRLPVMSQYRHFVEAGGLMSYGIDLRDHYRRAASYVDRILKGAKPGDLPVEQPTKFELVINLKTAKALGVTIPSSLLLRADQVIQ